MYKPLICMDYIHICTVHSIKPNLAFNHAKQEKIIRSCARWVTRTYCEECRIYHVRRLTQLNAEFCNKEIHRTMHELCIIICISCIGAVVVPDTFFAPYRGLRPIKVVHNTIAPSPQSELQVGFLPSVAFLDYDKVHKNCSHYSLI